MWHAYTEFRIAGTLKSINIHAYIRTRVVLCLPEKMLAIAAMMKLIITPGPARFFATIPATRYIPVPQHEPTPSDVKSRVSRHFCAGESINGIQKKIK